MCKSDKRKVYLTGQLITIIVTMFRVGLIALFGGTISYYFSLKAMSVILLSGGLVAVSSAVGLLYLAFRD